MGEHMNCCAHAALPTRSSRVRKGQRGSSLFLALIALVALMIAGLALMRSVDTTNLIAGNFAFKQASLHAADVGIENAFAELSTIVATSLELNYPSGCGAGGCKYYPLQQAVDSRGIPSSIDWTSVPSSTVNGDYQVQYVIDRLCTGSLPVTDITANCYSDLPKGGGSKKSGATVFSSAQQVYYRVTVRVVGPRNTTSFVQSLLAR